MDDTMINMNDNLTAQAMQDQIIQEAYETYVYTLTLLSGTVLLLYTTVLDMTQEIEYIWLKKISLPSLLYVFTRYGWLISQGLNFALNFVPLVSICNKIANAGDSMSFLSHFGVQGLLIARAHSLCRGNKIVTGFLALGFFSGVVLYLFGKEFEVLQLLGIQDSIISTLNSLYPVTIAFNGCQPNELSHEAGLVILLTNITTIATDCIIFGICWWNVWGTWKLKRETGIQSSNDLVSILLKQIVTRICFVLVVTITSTIVNEVSENSFALDIVIAFQGSLSAILVAGFTLDLRQRNAASIEANVLPLTTSTLQFRSMLQHIHQSFLVEMADNDEIDSEEALAGDEGSSNVGPEFSDEAQCTQDLDQTASPSSPGTGAPA